MQHYLNFKPTHPLLIAITVATITGCANSGSAKLPKSVNVVPFKSIETGVESSWDKDNAFPFTGGAAIDVDNNGTMEVFISGGHNQADKLLSYQNDRLQDIATESGLAKSAASYGATAIDMNSDGQTDLLVARHDGLWLHTNTNGRFSGQKIAYTRNGNENLLTVAVADIDLDGDIDLYLSNFIAYKQWIPATFNKPDHIANNILLRNDGNLKFTDITAASGTAGTQNTFLSVFTDLNADGYQDLVVSNNTGTLEIFHNNRDSTFTQNSYNSGLGYWMGLGVGDFDADGDQDLASSNVSNTIPGKLIRGDLTDDQTLEVEWVLLSNDGKQQFTDVTEKSGLTGLGFGWGIVFEDLNLDGELDLLAAQSYIKWPPHQFKKLRGKAMLQVVGENGRQFYDSPALELVNNNYGQSAIVADLNGDARQDVVWVNMDGPVLAALNQNTNEVVTLAVPENAKWLGARVTALTSSGRSYTREVNNAVGMQTDQSPHLSFAIPVGGSINSLEVEFADGSTSSIVPSKPGLVSVN